MPTKTVEKLCNRKACGHCTQTIESLKGDLTKALRRVRVLEADRLKWRDKYWSLVGQYAEENDGKA